VKLINQITEKAYPMQRVGPYTTARGELRIEKKEQAIEWHCDDLGEKDAVLLGAPRIEVIEASTGAKNFLKECLLFISSDGEPMCEGIPLMGTELPRLRPCTKDRVFFAASEDDEPRGIFITNGTWLKAVVKASRVIEEMPKIRITIEAELYRALEVANDG